MLFGGNFRTDSPSYVTDSWNILKNFENERGVNAKEVHNKGRKFNSLGYVEILSCRDRIYKKLIGKYVYGNICSVFVWREWKKLQLTASPQIEIWNRNHQDKQLGESEKTPPSHTLTFSKCIKSFPLLHTLSSLFYSHIILYRSLSFDLSQKWIQWNQVPLA